MRNITIDYHLDPRGGLRGWLTLVGYGRWVGWVPKFVNRAPAANLAGPAAALSRYRVPKGIAWGAARPNNHKWPVDLPGMAQSGPSATPALFVERFRHGIQLLTMADDNLVAHKWWAGYFLPIQVTVCTFINQPNGGVSIDAGLRAKFTHHTVCRFVSTDAITVVELVALFPPFYDVSKRAELAFSYVVLAACKAILHTCLRSLYFAGLPITPAVTSTIPRCIKARSTRRTSLFRTAMRYVLAVLALSVVRGTKTSADITAASFSGVSN